MIRVRALVIAVGIASVAASALADDVADLELLKWSEVSGPGFRLYTNAPERVAERTVDRLVRFVGAAETMMPGARVDPATRSTTIIAFATSAQMAKFPFRDASAYMTPTLRGNIVTLPLDRRRVATAFLYHEMAHVLARNDGGLAYPTWYNEGFAEFLSSAVIREDVASIGRLPPYRREVLQGGALTPIDQLLLARNTGDAGDPEVFYATSWLLVHWLHSKQSDLGKRLGLYFHAVHAGEDRVGAFERVFDVPTESLGAALAAHRDLLLAGPYVAEVTIEERELPLRRRKMPAREVAVVLGEHALRQDKAPLALRLFEHASAGAVFFEDAELGLSAVALLQDRPDDARAIAQATVERTGSARAYRSLGEALTALAWADSDEPDPGRLEQARNAFRRATELEPESADAWRGLARAFIGDAGADLAEGLAAIERTRASNPWFYSTHLTQARLHAQAGDLTATIRHLEIAAELAHSRAEADRVRQFVSQVRAAGLPGLLHAAQGPEQEPAD